MLRDKLKKIQHGVVLYRRASVENCQFSVKEARLESTPHIGRGSSFRVSFTGLRGPSTGALSLDVRAPPFCGAYVPDKEGVMPSCFMKCIL